jgi:hypothetical protein
VKCSGFWLVAEISRGSSLSHTNRRAAIAAGLDGSRSLISKYFKQHPRNLTNPISASPVLQVLLSTLRSPLSNLLGFPRSSIHSHYSPQKQPNMDSVNVPRKLWEHPDPKSTEMYRLMQEINAKHNLQLNVSLLSRCFPARQY